MKAQPDSIILAGVKTLAFSASGFQVLDGMESVRARVNQRLSWWQGEWFLNPDGGVPYLNILGRALEPRLVAGALVSEARLVPDVLSAQATDIQQDGVSLAIEIEIVSRFGTFRVTRSL